MSSLEREVAPEERLTYQSVITLVSLLENLETKHENLDLSSFINLAVWLVAHSESISDTKNKNGQVAFRYILQTLIDLVDSKKAQTIQGLKEMVGSPAKLWPLANLVVMSI